MSIEVEDFLAHFGVKGMKWGVRKSDPAEASKHKGEVILQKACKNGTVLTITKVDKTTRIDKKLAAKDPSYQELLNSVHHFDFTNKEGLKVGTASFMQDTPTSLQLEWIGVKRAHRSNGYARAALEGVIEYSKTNGITDLELSATKMGRPLYEKLGFVEGKDHVHRLHIPEEVKHAILDAKTLADFIMHQIDLDPELNAEEASHMNADDFLAHFGVKGMKWGVRRDARLTGHSNYNKDFVQKEDVYRITARAGSRKMKDIAYVSTNDIDNKRYIHILNHTISAKLFKDAKYETQLVLGPTKPLKAPSITRAESEMQKLYETNPKVQKFVKDNQVYFGENPSKDKLNQVMNTAIVDDDVLFTGAKAMRQEVKQHFQKIGYNSLLDQNDIREGLAKAPLIVFDPEKTLRVVSKSKIDAVIQKAATTTYKDTKKSGWVG